MRSNVTKAFVEKSCSPHRWIQYDQRYPREPLGPTLELMAAKMLLEHIAPPVVRVSSLAVGQTGHVLDYAICVDSVDYSTYLRSDATLVKEGRSTVAVTRQEDGFAISLGNKSVRFRPTRIPNPGDLIPVLSIGVESQTYRFSKAVGESGSPESAEEGPAWDDADAAIMPAPRLLSPSRHVRDMAVGEAGYVSSWDFSIDEASRGTFVSKNALLSEIRTPNTVYVTAESDGLHVRIQHPSTRFLPGGTGDRDSLQPVVEVIELCEPDQQVRL